jgi:hypothetical protein
MPATKAELVALVRGEISRLEKRTTKRDYTAMHYSELHHIMFLMKAAADALQVEIDKSSMLENDE